MVFEQLEVWKRSARLPANVYKYFATNTDYGFKDQITRSDIACNAVMITPLVVFTDFFSIERRSCVNG
ncbi:MAG: hypothetical protein OFPII_43660 [Osedax symbiont Rs1]|nr:MAG: hypothetical protein OFPII_43660 [Osedax symbiont Rs1]